MRHDNDNDLPRSRAEAKRLGIGRYFTGKPCVNGHLLERRTDSGACVQCGRDRENAKNRKDPQPNRKRANDYYWNNRDEINAKNRSARAENPERFRERERRRVRDKEKDRATRARRLQEKGDEIRAGDRERYYKNKPAYYARNQTRRALRWGGNGKHTPDDIANLIKTQGYKCAECGTSVKKKSSRHTDHIMPLSLGGSNNKDNLQILCIKCNLQKSNKHPLDFARERGRLV